MDESNNKSSPAPATAPAAIPLFSLPSVFSKKDPGGIGFIDDMGGGVDGLMSCTESLGFESSDERIDQQMEEEMDARRTTHHYDHQASSNNKAVRRKDNHQRHNQEVKKKFPPPLSSFNRNGQPSFFLRSVRSDGRLELTEVRIVRPEILRASREDGRLRLHLITEDEDDEVDINSKYNEYEQQDEEEEEETQEEEEEEEEEEETLQEDENMEEEKTLAEEEERVGEWKLEGFRRCNKMTGPHDYHHHHHQQQHSHLYVWSQQCVPTR